MKKFEEIKPGPSALAMLKALRAGQIIRVHWRIREDLPDGKAGQKERLQVFEGLVIARKHGSESGATITVRRDKSGFGVERIFPIHSPLIEKIELLKQTKVRRAKLYYLRRKRE